MADIKRLHYFDHQFLVEADFTDEQQYHLDMRRRHNRVLHTFGVAEGLQVEKTGNTQITVRPGTALDRDGREMVLDVDYPLNLSYPPGSSIYVTITYQEEETDPTTATGVTGNTRITEKPQIDASTTLPPEDSSVVCLCHFVLDGSGNVPGKIGDTFDNGVRQIATPVISSGSIGNAELADGSVTNSKLADNSVNAAKIVNGSVGNAELADGAVTNSKLADNSVNAAKIVNGSIGNAELADGSVTNSKLADINENKILFHNEGHDHSGGVQGKRIVVSDLATRYLVKETASPDNHIIFNSINSCLEYIKVDRSRIGKIYVLPKNNGDAWKENIKLHANELDWSGLEIEFDNAAILEGEDNTEPTIWIDGAGKSPKFLDDVKFMEYDPENGVYGEFKCIVEYITSPPDPPDLPLSVLDYPYVGFWPDFYLVDSYSKEEKGNTLEFKFQLAENYYGSPQQNFAIFFYGGFFHKIKIKVNIDNKNKPGKKGLVCGFAEVTHEGSIENCVNNNNDEIDVSELEVPFWYRLISERNRHGAGVVSIFSYLSTGNIKNCYSKGNGAGIVVIGSSVKTGDIFNCKSERDGGGIYAGPGGPIETGHIGSCSAIGSGGALYAKDTTARIKSIKGCSCQNNGGGFYGSHLDAEIGVLEHCYAYQGGGFFVGHSKINLGSIKECSATQGSSVFYIENSCHIIFGRAYRNHGGTILYAEYPTTCIVQGILDLSESTYDPLAPYSEFGQNFILVEGRSGTGAGRL